MTNSRQKAVFGKKKMRNSRISSLLGDSVDERLKPDDHSKPGLIKGARECWGDPIPFPIKNVVVNLTMFEGFTS